jgi:hypothetical protein
VPGSFFAGAFFKVAEHDRHAVAIRQPIDFFVDGSREAAWLMATGLAMCRCSKTLRKCLSPARLKAQSPSSTAGNTV